MQKKIRHHAENIGLTIRLGGGVAYDGRKGLKLANVVYCDSKIEILNFGDGIFNVSVCELMFKRIYSKLPLFKQ